MQPRPPPGYPGGLGQRCHPGLGGGPGPDMVLSGAGISFPCRGGRMARPGYGGLGRSQECRARGVEYCIRTTSAWRCVAGQPLQHHRCGSWPEVCNFPLEADPRALRRSWPPSSHRTRGAGPCTGAARGARGACAPRYHAPGGGKGRGRRRKKEQRVVTRASVSLGKARFPPLRHWRGRGVPRDHQGAPKGNPRPGPAAHAHLRCDLEK